MKLAAAVVIASLSAAPCVYGQDVPRGVVPGKGSYFCEIDVVWPGERGPSPAISRVERTPGSQLVIRVGKRHVYTFRTMEESWAYVADEIVIAVSGSRFGDDVVDALTYRNRTKSWDATQNRSEIGPQEIRLFNSIARQLAGCERIPVKP
jgi:hypothetical protein